MNKHIRWVLIVVMCYIAVVIFLLFAGMDNDIIGIPFSVFMIGMLCAMGVVGVISFFCMIHCFMRKDMSVLKRWIWIILLFLANWLACFFYLKHSNYYGKNPREEI